MIALFSAPRRRNTAEDENAPDRIRTYDLRFRKPLLDSASDAADNTYNTPGGAISSSASSTRPESAIPHAPRSGSDAPNRTPTNAGPTPEDRELADRTPTDPELAEVARAWPTLPAAIRAAALALIRAAGAGDVTGKRDR
ncbi:hypothetical protein RAS1_37910 [Phycisphaerae bacterium RAS1]|nr:hypothetical protein RAS1_37910 [Phycisphaerae bacterium RAS1]